ncbi:MAG: hypothetical protein JWM11_8051 [Planctomycetaceae bacterium]|nr:hypothetical protein [Planctomycetaceae bacterium]
MSNLMHAHRELYKRTPDEQFQSMESLFTHCEAQRNVSRDVWRPPQDVRPRTQGDSLILGAGSDGDLHLNDWSFSQLCRLALVSKETVNRVAPDTASRILIDTMPTGSKPLQMLVTNDTLKSIHGVAYSRLWNSQLLEMVRQAAGEFCPPPPAMNGGTGLYCGEQDLFCFLIDPQGWVEINGENFAPGFFIWNSEVGRRSLGISTFWFQSVCRNHIVWDAVEVLEFKRKHTGNISESLGEIRRMIEDLAAKRDARRDGFNRTIIKAMETSLGSNMDEATKSLLKEGLPKDAVMKALQSLNREGKPFTLWNLVDALTHENVSLAYAGDRLEADVKIAKLLTLAL